MAKALLGYLGPDAHLPAVAAQRAAEVRRLTDRVRDLEAQVVALQRENDLLSAAAAESVAGSLADLDEARLHV